MDFSTQNILQNMNKSVILLLWNNNRQEHKTTTYVNIQNITKSVFQYVRMYFINIERKTRRFIVGY